jgi:hypothetical protein
MKFLPIRWPHALIAGLLCHLAAAAQGQPEAVRENLFFQFEVVARTGQDGFTTLQPHPSINNRGTVAFVGRKGTGNEAVENVYTRTREASGETTLRSMFRQDLAPHADGDSPRQTFASDVQINNRNQVLVRRYLTARAQFAFPIGQILDTPLTYLELYTA